MLHLSSCSFDRTSTLTSLVCSPCFRFHLETLETASKEIDLKGVSITVGRNEVLQDSHLRLKAGVRYALLGRCVPSLPPSPFLQRRNEANFQSLAPETDPESRPSLSL